MSRKVYRIIKFLLFAGSLLLLTTWCLADDMLAADSDLCPGTTLDVHSFDIDGSSIGWSNDYDPGSEGCASGWDQPGPDVVYHLFFERYKDLRISMTPYGEYDCSLYVVSDCEDIAGTCLVGADDYGAGGAEIINMSIQPESDWYIICDGFYITMGGEFNLFIEDLSPATPTPNYAWTPSATPSPLPTTTPTPSPSPSATPVITPDQPHDILIYAHVIGNPAADPTLVRLTGKPGAVTGAGVASGEVHILIENTSHPLNPQLDIPVQADGSFTSTEIEVSNNADILQLTTERLGFMGPELHRCAAVADVNTTRSGPPVYDDGVTLGDTVMVRYSYLNEESATEFPERDINGSASISVTDVVMCRGIYLENLLNH